jgi:hypothetical protein
MSAINPKASSGRGVADGTGVGVQGSFITRVLVVVGRLVGIGVGNSTVGP